MTKSFSNGDGTVCLIIADDELADEVREEQIARTSILLKTNDYTHDKRATCMPAHVAFAAYRGFKVLFGERLHARNYVSTFTALPFPDLSPR